jgi:DNA polymerase-3 subunit gamma/tau
VFYTKYRPQKFSELFGLEPIARALTSQLEKNQVGHAYLFYGPRGTGKTTMARLLAKAVNCESSRADEGHLGGVRKNHLSGGGTGGAEPCGKCETCKAIQEGRFLDLIEIDAASNRGIDDIRNLREKIGLAPASGPKKVYVVDEAHMLTKEAFNALLKTLEEPPSHAILILCTTEAHKIPETIRSRCQKFEFKRASTRDIVSKMKFIVEGEGAEVEEKDLELLAKNAEGGFRDAETMLEQMIVGGLPAAEVVGLTAGESVGEFVDNLLNKQVREAIQFINRTYESGSNLSNFNQTVLEHLRGLLLIKNGVGEKLLEAPEENYKRMKQQAERLSVQNLDFMITEFTQVGFQLPNSTIPQLPLELVVMRVCEKLEMGSGRYEVGDEKRTENPHKIPPEDKNCSPDSKPASGIVNKWDMVLQTVRSYNHSLEALLKSSRPLKMEGENLILEVFYKFHKERLEESRNRGILEKVLNEVLGLPVKVRCVLGKKGAAAQDEIGDFDAVEKQAVEVFNGEL